MKGGRFYVEPWPDPRPIATPVERFRRFKMRPPPGMVFPVAKVPEYGTPEYEAFYNFQANQTIPSMRTSTMNKKDLPKYQCHKIVQAMQIGQIDEIPRGLTDRYCRLYPINSDMGREYIEVAEDYIIRHSPRVGGYYVLYEDGYESYSPKDAFEQGYTRLDRMGYTMKVPSMTESAAAMAAEAAKEPASFIPAEEATPVTDLPLYDPESACPKCGHEKAATTFDSIDQRMRRVCLQCDAVRWERPLDQAMPVERKFHEGDVVTIANGTDPYEGRRGEVLAVEEGNSPDDSPSYTVQIHAAAGRPVARYRAGELEHAKEENTA